MHNSSSVWSARTTVRRLAILAILLMTFTLGARAAQYVIYNGTYFLAIKNKNGIEATSTFNPSTCIWTGPENGSSGYLSIQYNGATYYLNRNGSSLAISTNASTYWNASGNDLYTVVSAFYGSQNYYIYHSNGWKNHNQKNNNVTT